MAKTIPARGPHFAVGPLRYDVVVPQQNPIERVGGGFEIAAIFREDDLLDHRVDRWILDADHIERAGLVGGLRAPETALLVTGRERFAPGESDDIEVPIAQPIFVLRLVDGAHCDRDAEPLQRRLEEQEYAFETRIGGQKLDRIGFAGLYIDELLIAHLVAGVLQQVQRLAQIGPNLFGITVDRVGKGLLEHFRRDLVAHGFEELEFASTRQSGAGELGAFEVAGDTLVLIVENLLVHFFEIERAIESKPQPRVLEFWPPDIERERLHHAGIANRELLEQDALVRNRREIVSRGPVLGAVLV